MFFPSADPISTDKEHQQGLSGGQGITLFCAFVTFAHAQRISEAFLLLLQRTTCMEEASKHGWSDLWPSSSVLLPSGASPCAACTSRTTLLTPLTTDSLIRESWILPIMQITYLVPSSPLLLNMYSFSVSNFNKKQEKLIETDWRDEYNTKFLNTLSYLLPLFPISGHTDEWQGSYE